MTGRSTFYLHTRVADGFAVNSTALDGPVVIVEWVEAKFGKRKYNRGA